MNDYKLMNTSIVRGMLGSFHDVCMFWCFWSILKDLNVVLVRIVDIFG